MAQCIDRRLDVDASRTRSRLGWAPTERLGIIRRMPFLAQNRKDYPHEWLKRNRVAARRGRLRVPSRIQAALAAHETTVLRRFEERLRDPARRRRFSGYLDCSPTHLEEQHNLIMGQLLCTIRTGEKGIFMNCCQALAERWREEGRPLEQLEEALNDLGQVCVATLRGAPEAVGLEPALYDHVTMTFQFAIDAVREVAERPE